MAARRSEQISFVVWLAIAVGINVLALLVINWIFDSVAIDGFWSYALGALTTLGSFFVIALYLVFMVRSTRPLRTLESDEPSLLPTGAD